MILSFLYDLNRLGRNQWLSAAELRKFQRRKLQAIVKYAYVNVEYYRHLFDSVGIKPEEIKDEADLARIPITTKEQLQKLPIEKITAKGINIHRCRKVRTSGSTGTPLDIIMDEKDELIRGLNLK